MPSAPASPSLPATEFGSFRNGQCNVQQTDPKATAIHHVHAVAPQFDVIGWNELGTHALQLAVAHLPGFTSFMPGWSPKLPIGKSSSAAAVSISWRTDSFDLVESGSIRVHGGVPHITPSRWINWVLLRHKSTGYEFYRINTHVVHHIEGGGRALKRGLLVGQLARAKKHFAKLAAVTSALGRMHPVIGGGDLNVNYLAEKHLPPSRRTKWFPYTVLGKVASLPEPNHGTHGGRLIDWTWTVGLKTGNQIVLPRGSSDHNPVATKVLL